ncbi:hypothetical protein F25303_9478 [Fusarium sp. NRRL 25303]|nr:hypothetical protein F25303_9478 [Fusarium sp. NRRL 25303]
MPASHPHYASRSFAAVKIVIIDRLDLQMESALLAEIMYPHIIPAEALGDAEEEEMRANGLVDKQNSAIPYRAPSQEALYTIPLNRKTKDEYTTQAMAEYLFTNRSNLPLKYQFWQNARFIELKKEDDSGWSSHSQVLPSGSDLAPSPLPERYPNVLKTENSDDVQIITYTKTKATLYSLQDAEDCHVLSNCINKSKASKQCWLTFLSVLYTREDEKAVVKVKKGSWKPGITKQLHSIQ